MIKKYSSKVRSFLKLNEVEVNVFPSHLAFYLIFLIIPIISFIGILGSKIDKDLILLYFNNNIPNFLISNININVSNIYLYIIISLSITSRGMRAVIISSNLLFNIKDNNNIKIRIKSIILVIILFMLIIFLVLVPVLGDLIINYLTRDLTIINLYYLLKYPFSFIFIFILIKTIYTFAPSKIINYSCMNRGALFTTFMWIIISRLYLMYLNNFNNYDLYYGNLANILILLIWIYFLAYIFVIGMLINRKCYFKSCKKEKNKI